MKNILLILRHEFVTRVSKKSFIIMTLLGPVLIGLFYGSIAAISIYQFSESKSRKVLIYDPYNSLDARIEKSKDFDFVFTDDPTKARKDLETEKIDVLLDIRNKKGDSMQLVAKNSLSLTERSEIKDILSNQYFNKRLSEKGITKSNLDSMRPKIVLSDQLLSGKGSATEIRSGIGYVGALIIYMFIFMYGVMIMRGVTEEKNNRIVEIIISAVKPFELMMGKILGVALVGLTQFISWIVLSGLLVTVLSIALGADQVNTGTAAIQAGQTNEFAELANGISSQLSSLNFVKLITGFIIFFFGGFLLYSSLFAAIGSAVDSDTETQQFMFPVSMPLIFGLIIAQIAVIKDPNSSMAVWCSMIPFTSPVVMMVRLPFDVSWLEIFTSALILFSTFIVIVWLAGKIYRIGILSYGQKASYKQIFKWMIAKDSVNPGTAKTKN